MFCRRQRLFQSGHGVSRPELHQHVGRTQTFRRLAKRLGVVEEGDLDLVGGLGQPGLHAVGPSWTPNPGLFAPCAVEVRPKLVCTGAVVKSGLWDVADDGDTWQVVFQTSKSLKGHAQRAKIVAGVVLEQHASLRPLDARQAPRHGFQRGPVRGEVGQRCAMVQGDQRRGQRVVHGHVVVHAELHLRGLPFPRQLETTRMLCGGGLEVGLGCLPIQTPGHGRAVQKVLRRRQQGCGHEDLATTAKQAAFFSGQVTCIFEIPEMGFPQVGQHPLCGCDAALKFGHLLGQADARFDQGEVVVRA